MVKKVKQNKTKCKKSKKLAEIPDKEKQRNNSKCNIKTNLKYKSITIKNEYNKANEVLQ